MRNHVNCHWNTSFSLIMATNNTKITFPNHVAILRWRVCRLPPNIQAHATNVNSNRIPLKKTILFRLPLIRCYISCANATCGCDICANPHAHKATCAKRRMRTTPHGSFEWRTEKTLCAHVVGACGFVHMSFPHVSFVHETGNPLLIMIMDNGSADCSNMTRGWGCLGKFVIFINWNTKCQGAVVILCITDDLKNTLSMTNLSNIFLSSVAKWKTGSNHPRFAIGECYLTETFW